MTLYLFEYNNYYNRIVKKLPTIQDYEQEGNLLDAIYNVTFIPNDGISTEHIINYEANKGNYVIITDGPNDEIISRWFVTEAVRVRAGQYKLSLYRDVIADWYDEIVEAPMFIRKGYPQSVNDSAIFNNETMTYNQIKKGETFIKDKTKSGWYVGYLSKDLGDKTVNLPGTPVNSSGTYSTAAEYPYSKYTEENPYIGDYTDITYIMFTYASATELTQAHGWDDKGDPKNPDLEGFDWKVSNQPIGRRVKYDYKQGYKTKSSIVSADVWSHASGANWRSSSYTITGIHNSEQTSNFYNSENGRVILIGGVPKKVRLTAHSHSAVVYPANDSAFAMLVKNHIASQVSWINTDANFIVGNTTAINYTAVAYSVSFEDVDETSYSYTIPAARRHTDDVPYDVFAIPSGLVKVAGTPYYSNPLLAKKLITAITTDLVSGEGNVELFDVQFLPYCPLSDDYLADEEILTSSLKNTTDIKDYSLITVAPTNWTIIVYASSSGFNKIITENPIPVPSKPISFKVANETEFYRLCSPNYNGQFEFSATKNGGVSVWNITFLYKPYTPYIKVAPKFGRLYGGNFGDARGLICGGDFSLPQTNNAWRQYELENKNYQVMFDRQIQNMEVNNSVQRELEKWNIGTGAIQGAAGGAMVGSMIGGGYGAVAGAIVGGVASGLGGAIDRRLNETLRKEAINYAQDQFGYNLQNIKALPYSLTKIGSQNEDYKIWPFVEKYTCTETEKAALRDKLKWNGYTIERIGKITNFLNPDDETFIQGTLIRLDTINEDSHIVDVINTELQRGVYMT